MAIIETECDFEPCGRAVMYGGAATMAKPAAVEGEEMKAPNGRIAVLVDGLWAGYLCIEGGGSRGGGSREIAAFDVEELSGGKLLATFRRNIGGKNKKQLNKRIHHDKDIKLFDAQTPSGDRCQLFTL